MSTPYRQFGLYVVVTFAFSWLCILPQYLINELGFIGSVAAMLGAFGPLVGALVAVYASGEDVLSWFRERIQYPGTGILLAAVVLALCIEAGRLIVYGMLGNHLTPSALFAYIDQPLALAVVPVNYILAALLSGGQEEFGWRGYALPQLQPSLGTSIASVVIGIIWALWHLPFYVFGNRGGIASFIAYAAVVILFSVVLTAVFNASRGSVLAVMLLHAGFNFFQQRARDLVVVSPVDWSYSLAALPILVILSAGLMYWCETTTQSSSDTQPNA